MMDIELDFPDLSESVLPADGALPARYQSQEVSLGYILVRRAGRYDKIVLALRWHRRLLLLFGALWGKCPGRVVGVIITIIMIKKYMCNNNKCVMIHL